MNEDERKQKNKRLAEYKEYDKILQTLDHNDHHDLAAHLLNTAHHRAKQQAITSNDKKKRRRLGRPKKDGTLAIYDRWTAWPLPASLVPRPTPIPSTSTNAHEYSNSEALSAEIEAAILRTARSRIHSEGGTVSANEHAPYHVTREITTQVMTKFDQLLHAFGRVKYQQIHSERIRQRQLPSRWDEVIMLAEIAGLVNSPETRARIRERCNQLFNEEIPGSTDTQQRNE